MSGVPCFVEPLKHCHSGEATNFDLFKDPFPRRLGVDNEFIPHALFDLRFMPMFMVEYFVIPFNPDGSQSDAPE